MNQVILIGRLGKDAEVRSTGSGTEVASFSVATSRRYKGSDGDYKEETEWTNISYWKPGNLANYLKKGTQLAVTGRLSTRSYEKDGEKRYATEVVAEKIELLGSGGGQSDRSETAPAAKKSNSLEITDEDLPF